MFCLALLKKHNINIAINQKEIHVSCELSLEYLYINHLFCGCKSYVGSNQDVIEEDKTTTIHCKIYMFAHMKKLHR